MPKGGLEEAESLEQLRAMEAGVRIRTVLVDYEGFGVDTESDLERMAAILTPAT
jgi:3-deoxy-manno-octulosonate cytidylyltransferase (CMP-KDO synthetase)